MLLARGAKLHKIVTDKDKIHHKDKINPYVTVILLKKRRAKIHKIVKHKDNIHQSIAVMLPARGAKIQKMVTYKNKIHSSITGKGSKDTQDSYIQSLQNASTLEILMIFTYNAAMAHQQDTVYVIVMPSHGGITLSLPLFSGIFSKLVRYRYFATMVLGVGPSSGSQFTLAG